MADIAAALRNSGREPELFADFYRDRYEAIVAYFARRVADPEAALDLTAESFAQAFISRRRFRGSEPAQAEAWMFRIAERKLWRYQRRGKIETRALGRLRIEAPPIDAEQRARVEELADLQGLRDVLREELEQLSRGQREAIGLRVIEDLSYSDVARKLAITEQAARARVSRGLKTLADALESNPTLKEERT